MTKNDDANSLRRIGAPSREVQIGRTATDPSKKFALETTRGV
jgi:hypothetical protein